MKVIEVLNEWNSAPRCSVAAQAACGDALFAGPTLHIQVTDELILSAAFSTQIAGHAAGDPNLLDLTNFSPNKAFLRLVVEF